MTHNGEPKLSSWTLGAIQSSGMKLEGTCVTPGCNQFAFFNVDELIETFGAEWLVPEILPVKCIECGEWYKFVLSVLHDDDPDKDGA